MAADTLTLAARSLAPSSADAKSTKAKLTGVAESSVFLETPSLMLVGAEPATAVMALIRSASETVFGIPEMNS